MAISHEQNKLVAQALVKESDRGWVILGAALLADALEELLRSACRKTPKDVKTTVDPLFQGYAPLATFSAKIQLTFALGILPRALRDKIEIIRRLRNDFAHEWGPIDFSDPRCASRLPLIVRQSSDEDDEEQQESDQQEPLIGLASLAPSKEQLVTRIAFVLSIQDILVAISRLAGLASEGVDIRPVVSQMEEEGLWVGPT